MGLAEGAGSPWTLWVPGWVGWQWWLGPLCAPSATLEAAALCPPGTVPPLGGSLVSVGPVPLRVSVRVGTLRVWAGVPTAFPQRPHPRSLFASRCLFLCFV